MSAVPRFAEAVDWHSGTIRGEGRLTVQGADLVRGVAEQLHRCGHRRITVDLAAVGAVDDAAVAVLRSLVEELRTATGELVLLPPSDDPAPQPTTASASNSAPIGRAATPIAVRAGYGSVKNSR